MITSVLFLLAGEALVWQSWPIGWWAMVFFAATSIYFPLSEEKGLEHRFGDDYLALQGQRAALVSPFDAMESTTGLTPKGNRASGKEARLRIREGVVEKGRLRCVEAIMALFGARFSDGDHRRRFILKFLQKL
jgi:hypothetical protein